MNAFKHLLTSIIALIYIRTGFADVQQIIGGSPAKVGSAPYHVSLQNMDGSQVCGGSIISGRHVLSAAHCFVGARPEYIVIVAGIVDLNLKGERYEVAEIFSHEGYSKDNKMNDIAILKTKSEIVFTQYVNQMNISKSSVIDGSFTFIGFGFTTNPGNASRFLNVINLNLLDMETCKYAYRNIRDLYDSQLCTFNDVGQGACYGDSGSPLVDNASNLIGISSFGIPCAVGFPDVFTKVPSFVDWIESVTSMSSRPTMAHTIIALQLILSLFINVF